MIIYSLIYVSMYSIFLEATKSKRFLSGLTISGPPGVDAVVSRPHGRHHRNASTEELDHQVVGGQVMAGDRKISKSWNPCGETCDKPPKNVWFLGMLSDVSRG